MADMETDNVFELGTSEHHLCDHALSIMIFIKQELSNQQVRLI